MAHKTLIGGTAYEITGGKALVNGTGYSIDKGKTLVGGTAYEVGFASWPDDLDTGLEFASASPFTISVSSPKWDGTLEYSNGKEWTPWDGSEISSGKGENGHCIYIRGTGNTIISGSSSVLTYQWTLNGTDIECNGNIEKLLDYTTVLAGRHPTMASYCYKALFMFCDALIKAPSLPATTLASSCYYSMFSNCINLIEAPSLPATTLASSCYYSMFCNCRNLIKAPSLPATTLADYCYRKMFESCRSLTEIPCLPATTLPVECYFWMFASCDKIKVSSTETGTYTKAYRVPSVGDGTGNTSSMQNMFFNTGGTFTRTPEINTTYYLDSSNTIV